MERALAKAAIESNDLPRIAKYGESAAADLGGRLSAAGPAGLRFWFWAARKRAEYAAKAYKYARAFEDLVDKMPVATGKDAARRQDEQERAISHALIYQARARTIQNDSQDALRLAARAFSAYPGEETAREWAEVLLQHGPAGARRSSTWPRRSSFRIPTPPIDKRQGDRQLLGELYRKLHGSEKGLGDLVLAAYDRVSTTVETRAQETAGAGSEFLPGGSHGVYALRVWTGKSSPWRA